MKVGDRVILEGDNGHVFKVKTITTDGINAEVVSIYDNRVQRYRVTDLKLTTKNPVILVETYGREWRDNVVKALDGSIKYKSYPVERSRDIIRFFVDAKKLTAAKGVLDEFYKNPPVVKVKEEVEPLNEEFTEDDDY